MNRKIRFNKEYYDGRELANMKLYLEKGYDFKGEASEYLKAHTGASQVLLTSGATSAMDLFLMGADLPKGSQVIMPSFTFPAAANAVLRAELRPVFADIDRHTLVMDMKEVVRKTTSETSCIMPVHYGGASMDMDKLVEFADGKDICVFEDAALAYDGYYKKRHLGTIGEAGVISFHKTKNISGDGGGVLLLNSEENSELYMELIANGTDRPAFMRGEVPEYTWQRPGAGAEMSNLTAALLLAQLKKDREILTKRETLWNQYYSLLDAAGIEEYAALAKVPEINKNNYHVFYLLFKTPALREFVRVQLVEAGIQAYVHYKPLHSAAGGRRLGYVESDLPITQNVSDCILRLPMHMGLNEDDVEFICEKLLMAVGNA